MSRLRPGTVAFETQSRHQSNQMKHFPILLVLLLAGCGESEQETLKRIKDRVQSGTITDEDAEHLSQRYDELLFLGGLTSITNKQAESLGKATSLRLSGLTSITNEQAKSLSKARSLYLDGITSITDEQAESLSKVEVLALGGLTSITDEQVENLSKVTTLDLNGLTSITDKQAESLSKVTWLELKGLTSITNSQWEILDREVLYLYIAVLPENHE